MSRERPKILESLNVHESWWFWDGDCCSQYLKEGVPFQILDSRNFTFLNMTIYKICRDPRYLNIFDIFDNLLKKVSLTPENERIRPLKGFFRSFWK